MKAQKQLQSFKGVGEVTAKEIIYARPAGGFKNIQDLGGNNDIVLLHNSRYKFTVPEQVLL